MKRAALAAFLAAAILAAVGATAPAATAHTELVTSTPADGATLAAAPAEVVLTFGDDLLPGTVAVSIRPADGSAAPVDAAVSGGTVTVPWPAGITDGPVAVAYRVVSADGHPVEGSIGFTLAGDRASVAPAASAVASPTATPTSPSGTARIPPLAWVSLGLAVGIAVGFALYLRRRRTP